MGFFCVLIFAQYSIRGGGGAGFNHPRHLKSWVPPPTGVLTIFFDCSLFYSMFNNTFLEKLLWFDWLLHEIFYYTLFQLYLGRHLTLSRVGKNFIRILLQLWPIIWNKTSCISVDCILSSPIVRNKKQFEGLNQLGLVVFRLICS